MPRGSNLKGPFKGVLNSGGVIAKYNCACGAKIDLRVDGHGNMQANCPKDTGCGTELRAKTTRSGEILARRAHGWIAGAKSQVYEICGIAPEPKPEPRPAPEPKPRPAPEPKPEPAPEPKPEPAPEPKPEPKKSLLARIFSDEEES